MIESMFGRDPLVLAGVALLLLALLRLVRSLRARHLQKQTLAALAEIEEDERRAERRAAARARGDDLTATCPLCGKHDSKRPFIRYAIDCHRDDCGSVEHADPFARDH